MQTVKRSEPDRSTRDEDLAGPARAPLHLVTLGTFKLLWRTEGGQMQDITYPFYQALNGRGPSVQLLKVLLCVGTPPRFCHQASRDALIEAIWGERASRVNVELALNAARSDLCRTLAPYAGADVLYRLGGPDRSGRGYGLVEHLLDIDADAFERAVARAAASEQSEPAHLRTLWLAAFEQVHGEFLPLDVYQDWTHERRQRIGASARLCLHRLAALSQSESELLEVSTLLHSYVLAHPQDYETLCLAVSLLTRQERHQDALDLCAHMRRALEMEEEEVPAELVALEKQLRRKLRAACLTQLKCASVAVTLSEPPAHLSSRVPGLVIPHSPLPAAAASGQGASWFDLTLKRMRVLIAAWRGRAMYCEELQAILDQEFAMTDVVKTLFEDFTLSRRRALLLLASLSAGLITAVREEPTSHKLLEEFLPQCAASLTACQHLMRDQEFWSVEKALKQYMPILEYVAQKPSLYQQAAARLAVEGRQILATLAWNHLNPQERILHYSKAVEYSRLVQDANLQVIMLSSLGSTYAQLENPTQAIAFYQEALQYEKAVSPLVRSSLYSRTAFTYAQLGQEQEALSYIDATHSILPDHPEDDPNFLLLDSSAYLSEGRAYFELSRLHTASEPLGKAYLEQAWNACGYITENAQTIPSERVRVEVINHQAKVALGQRDLEKFRQYFLEGVRGAKALNSQKRKQEAKENWKAATQVWGHERSVLELAEELMDG